jgi:hypothetical protein
MSSDKKNNKECINNCEDVNRYNEKIKCEICDVVYTKCNKVHHIKTKRHQNAELKKKVEYMEMNEVDKEQLKINDKEEKEKIKKNMMKQLKKLKKDMEKNMEKTIGKLTEKINVISENI